MTTTKKLFVLKMQKLLKDLYGLEPEDIYIDVEDFINNGDSPEDSVAFIARKHDLDMIRFPYVVV